MREDMKRRVLRLVWEWPTACTLICEIVMILVGVAFVVNPVHRTIKPTSPFYHWGVSGLLALGVAFIVVGTYAALYRERMAGIIPTMLFVGIALPAAVVDFNIIGIIFYGMFLVGGIEEARTRYERARLRKQWVVHVKRGES